MVDAISTVAPMASISDDTDPSASAPDSESLDGMDWVFPVSTIGADNIIIAGIGTRFSSSLDAVIAASIVTDDDWIEENTGIIHDKAPSAAHVRRPFGKAWAESPLRREPRSGSVIPQQPGRSVPSLSASVPSDTDSSIITERQHRLSLSHRGSETLDLLDQQAGSAEPSILPGLHSSASQRGRADCGLVGNEGGAEPYGASHDLWDDHSSDEGFVTVNTPSSSASGCSQQTAVAKNYSFVDSSYSPTASGTLGTSSPAHSELSASSIADDGERYNSMIDDTVDWLVRRLSTLMGRHRQTAGEQNQNPAQKTGPFSSTGSNHNSDGRERSNQKRQAVGEGSETGESGSKRLRLTKNPINEGGQHQRLACPFWKNDPMNHGTCYRRNLTKISYVKQHLDRRHSVPIHCVLCLRVFPTEEECRAHQRERSCDVREYVKPEGISPEQRELLKRRAQQNQSQEDQWFEIYRLLFPGSPLPYSPYIDDNFSEDLNKFHEFQLAQGSAILTERLFQKLPANIDLPKETLKRLVLEVQQEVWSVWPRLSGLVPDLDVTDDQSTRIYAAQSEAQTDVGIDGPADRFASITGGNIPLTAESGENVLRGLNPKDAAFKSHWSVTDARVSPLIIPRSAQGGAITKLRPQVRDSQSNSGSLHPAPFRQVAVSESMLALERPIMEAWLQSESIGEGGRFVHINLICRVMPELLWNFQVHFDSEKAVLVAVSEERRAADGTVRYSVDVKAPRQPQLQLLASGRRHTANVYVSLDEPNYMANAVLAGQFTYDGTAPQLPVGSVADQDARADHAVSGATSGMSRSGPMARWDGGRPPYTMDLSVSGQARGRSSPERPQSRDQDFSLPTIRPQSGR
jgi:hypothetical protein